MNRVHTSLVRHTYNFGDLRVCQPSALFARDNLLVRSRPTCPPPCPCPDPPTPRKQVNWNEMPLHYSRKVPERAYYLSLDVLTDFALDDALLSPALKLHHAGAP